MTTERQKLNDEKHNHMAEKINHIEKTTPHKKDVKRIEEKVDKVQETLNNETNGRLKKLEGWRMYMIGGLSVVTLLIVPVFIYVIEQFI